VRIVICEDNKIEQEKYKGILSEVISKNNIPRVLFEVFDTGTELLSDGNLDEDTVLFLDINMPGIDGVETANLIREKGYSGEIIFLTVSKEHILEAFDVSAFHYLVKDEVDDKRVEQVFLNAYNRTEKRKRKYITLSRNGEIRNVPLDSIQCIELKDRIMTAYYGEGEFFSFYSTMDKMEKILGADEFIRIHRAYIVGINQIEKIDNGIDVRMRTGKIIPIGRKYMDKCKKIFKRYGLC